VFNIQGSELIFLLLLALVILGPEKLPDAVRRFGRTYSEFKKFSAGFQGELRQALDEPMRELRETADAVRGAAKFDFDAEEKADPAASDSSDSSDDSSPTTSAGTSEIRPRRKVQRDTALNFGDPQRRTSRAAGDPSRDDSGATPERGGDGEEATE
jgi:sec-independent protein translocase protein TatB